jgi:hypothetical protein
VAVVVVVAAVWSVFASLVVVTVDTPRDVSWVV